MILDSINNAAKYLKNKYGQKIDYGIILGSGLSTIADSANNSIQIQYKEIPNWPLSTVMGHAGELVIGEIGKKNVLMMKGRIHYYEGYRMQDVTFPVRVMQKIGIKNIIITNAAGAVNPKFQPGDIMLITDHINFMGMAGENPLCGRNLDDYGPRFPDMSQAYDRRMMELTKQVAKTENVNLQEGVYAGLSGPSFETPAELRFLKYAGVDAVGMSTVPEVIVARHGGMCVLALSGISNKANLDGTTITTHDEVLEAGKIIAPKMQKIINGLINQFHIEQ